MSCVVLCRFFSRCVFLCAPMRDAHLEIELLLSLRFAGSGLDYAYVVV